MVTVSAASSLGRSISGGGVGEDPGQANEIVGSHREREHEAHARRATPHRAGEAADRLAPAERLFDQFAFLLTDGVAGVPRCAGVNRGCSALVVLRDVRRDTHCAQIGDEVGGVVAFVGADRDATLRSRIMSLDHELGGLPLGFAGRLRHLGLDDEPVPVLGHRVSDVAELRLFAFALFVEPRLQIGDGRMRCIAALLAMEVDLGVAALLRLGGGVGGHRCSLGRAWCGGQCGVWFNV